jgi:hypothetical protein
MRRLSDAQHETLAEQCDFDVRKINGWRSLPIVESWVFARCAVCVRRVRSCAVVCAAVRCCAAPHGKFALTNWSDEQTNAICRVGERCRCTLITYTLVNLQCHLMEGYFLIVTEAQSVVGPCRKQEAIRRSPWPGDGSDDDDDGASSSPPASSFSAFLVCP